MRIGVTRNSKQLEKLARRGAERGIEIVALPVTEVSPVAFEWPTRVSPDGIDWIVFTSANGVRAFFSRLAQLGISLSNSTRYAAIGGKTERALGEAGISVCVIPPEPYADRLFNTLAAEHLRPKATILYPRAAEIVSDPAERFDSARVQYIPLVCYQTRPVIPDQKTVERLRSEDCILFTAPSSVISYHRYSGPPLARPVAIGRTTATSMRSVGWESIEVLESPDIDLILEHAACC